MTDQNGGTISHVPSFENEEEEDAYYEALLDAEEWEDREAIRRVEQRVGSGWHVMKLHRYTPKLLKDIEEWCETNCHGEFRKEGWSSGCSYTVALCFRSTKDAVFYRLRWSGEAE